MCESERDLASRFGPGAKAANSLPLRAHVQTAGLCVRLSAAPQSRAHTLSSADYD
jgi:hypothetical protein